MTTTTKRQVSGRTTKSTKPKSRTSPQSSPTAVAALLKEEELKPTDAARLCGLHKDTFLKMLKDPKRWKWPVIRRSKRGPGSLGIPMSSVDAYRRSIVKVGGGL